MQRNLMGCLLLVVQISGEIVNVVVGVLQHQIDMRLQPVHLRDLRPFPVAQPGFGVAIREADLDYEIVDHGGSTGELLARLQSDRGRHVPAATTASARTASATPTS